jgi:hypothetical protein
MAHAETLDQAGELGEASKVGRQTSPSPRAIEDPVTSFATDRPRRLTLRRVGIPRIGAPD